MEQELLHKYFSGETLPEEEKRIMDWAEASPENYRDFLRERKLWNATLVHYALKEELPFAIRLRRLNLWKVASVAASIALLCALSWIFARPTQRVEGEWQSVVVPTGQRAQLLLSDGTKVWLNSNTTFSYPAGFGSDNREVKLNGEGFFEVTKNAERPFIVKTRKYDVKVLGTTFNVYAYEQESERFEASLLDGVIDIYTPNERGKIIRLTPNEQVSEIDGSLRKDKIENPDRFRWRDGLICLDDVPFERLIEQLSVYYDTPIQILNKQALTYRCTGKFRQSDGIEHALKVLQKDVSFSFGREPSGDTILIR